MWIIDSKEFESAAGTMHNQTKFRPLMPRSIPPHGLPIPAPPRPNPHYWSTQDPNLPPWNQNPSFMADYGGMRREMSTVPLVSSRWNPTPEQLQALEEMYRRGVRTPSAEQIQQIAARLRRFGKIEGKNVFYWFQNHKARERQRKRRHEMELLAGKKIRQVDTTSEQRRRQGLSKSYMEVEHPKKLPTSSELYSGLDNEELQQQAMAAAKGSTESSCCYCWQQLELSSSYMSPNHSMDKFGGPAIAAAAAKPFVVLESGIHESQTLELFPVKACEEEDEEEEEEEDDDEADYTDMGKSVLRPSPNHGHHHHHHQFFEFLPTKNC